VGRGDGRILVVARWPLGGIRTHLLYSFPTLRDAGFRCTFVVPDEPATTPLREGLEALGGAEIVGVPINGRRCRLWAGVRRQLRGGGFDLVHSHGLTAAWHAAIGRFGFAAPHLVTLHEPLRPSQFRGVAGRLKRWLLGSVLRRADALITVSEDSKTNLLETFPSLRQLEHRIQAISNGIDSERYVSFPQGECERRRLGRDARTPLIGFLGRFMPEKGFPVLLEALQGLTREPGGTAFHLVAYGSGDYRREYLRDIEARGLTTRVTMHEFVADVQPVLRQLDLVVVPSLWEASSLVSMEAMATGVPVLGADCPGLREVLRGTPSRTFRTGDAAALRHALRSALESPWTEAARSYAATARERFDNRRSARRLVELYAILSRRAR
jgi:glycosyltransferase involved in cell wall biosynthesis